MLDLAGRCSARFTGLTLSARQAAVAPRRRGKSRPRRSHRASKSAATILRPRARSISRSRSSRWRTRRIPTRASPPSSRGSRRAAGSRSSTTCPSRKRAARATSRCSSRAGACRVLASAAELKAALARRGLAIVADRDLTDELRPRTLARIARLENAEPRAAPLRAVGRACASCSIRTTAGSRSSVSIARR